jgi:glycosyltransferase involved in cell wall biosynthesis
LRGLLERFSAEYFPFDRSAKVKSGIRLLQRLVHDNPDVVVLEGTGLAGGLACIAGRALGVPYVVSSGDAVGPFLGINLPLARPLFTAYERALYGLAAGFIGWSPYLVGRALSFGSPRAMTAAGWAPFPRTRDELARSRARIRRKLGIDENAIVFGILGSLKWSSRVGYCYGFELVSAMRKVKRPDACVLVVGDGTGLDRLKRLAGDALGARVLLPGRVPKDEALDYLAAMDVASLPQSLDQVGAFRYTTKISEYLAASLPIVVGRIPLAYDLDDGWMWRLPGSAPETSEYIDHLAELIETVTHAEIAAKRAALPAHLADFDRERQVARVTGFLSELIEDARAARRDRR